MVQGAPRPAAVPRSAPCRCPVPSALRPVPSAWCSRHAGTGPEATAHLPRDASPEIPISELQKYRQNFLFFWEVLSSSSDPVRTQDAKPWLHWRQQGPTPGSRAVLVAFREHYHPCPQCAGRGCGIITSGSAAVWGAESSWTGSWQPAWSQ